LKKILIVDDSPGIRLLLTSIIEKWKGFNVTEVATVKSAISACTESKYDLIFLDHRMRDGVGWELAEKIILDPQKFGNPRIVAMSGSIFQDKDENTRKFYTEFIQKPFEVSRIDSILEELTEDSSPK